MAPRLLHSRLDVALAGGGLPLDTLSNLLLTAHMTQHLVLMAVAPPLILLGAPIVPMLRGLPRRLVRDALGPFLAWPALRRFAHRLTHPGVGLFGMTTAMWGWHVPGPYQLALQVPFWHDVEHVTFVAGSLLFWWSVVRPWPFTPHWSAWSIPPMLLLADVLNTAIAATLTFSGRVLYPVYEQVPRLGGLSALDDQVLAGVVMWVPGSLVFLDPRDHRDGPPALAGPPSSPEDRAEARGHRTSRAPFDLLATPLIGAFLRARRGRHVLQGTLLVLAIAVIADGLFGDQMAAMNLAGVLPWTYWRFFVIVGLLAVGNVFCMACPFMLPRELGRRLGLATRHWPRPLRSKWLAVILLALFFWAYEALAPVEQPALDRLDRRRLLRRRLRHRHAVPRRQLLQVRLPHRAVPVRELARLAIRGAAEGTECLRHLRDPRLPAWQRPAARM